MLYHVITLHDDTIAMSVTTVFQDYGWEVLYHLLYSPDLSPPDYDLFPKLKEPLQGIHFNYLSEQSSAKTQEIWHLTKKPSLTLDRKAAGMLVSMHFARGELH